MTVRIVPKYDNYGHEEKQELPQAEIDAYVKRAQEKFGDKCKQIDISVYGDEVELSYRLVNPPFERIRRITGYLVGTLDRWNDAKQAEERDRVKHNV